MTAGVAGRLSITVDFLHSYSIFSAFLKIQIHNLRYKSTSAKHSACYMAVVICAVTQVKDDC